MKPIALLLAVMALLVCRTARADAADEYVHLCPATSPSGPPSAEDAAACRRCVDEAVASQGGDTGTIRILELWTACQRRLAAEPAALEDVPAAELDAIPGEYRKAAERLNEIAGDLAPGRHQLSADQIESAIARVTAAVASEKGCRADKRCLSDRTARHAQEDFESRVLPAMCAADQQLEEDRAGTAHEKANPSGVVDLVLLHRYGAAIQTDEGILAGFLPTFTKKAHHAWRGYRVECR